MKEKVCSFEPNCILMVLLFTFKENAMKKLIPTLIILLFTQISFAQSLSGNLKASESEENLRYGNVDIYQDGELVASVLTDAVGNFNVSLDSGTYVCVVNFAGYKEIKKTVHVSSDEKNDFSMDVDPTAKKAIVPKSIPESEITITTDDIRSAPMMYESISYESDYDGRGRTSGDRSLKKRKAKGFTSAYDLGGADPGTYMSSMYDTEGRSGALTAGEINDFSKWDLWTDLASGELESYQAGWKLMLTGRYTLQLESSTGLPLADAKVELKERNGKVLYTSRTDNTGKAELWVSTSQNELPTKNLDMEISYAGLLKTIKNAKPFTESINHLMLDVECESNQNVDIAFVVDATGSMGDELSYLKAEMNDVIYKSKSISSKLNFRFANVFYRDHSDAYLTNKMDFSRILSESVSFVNEQSAGGGGDYEEAVEVALDTAINGLSWSDEARTRILFLILDAPPHNTDGIKDKLQILIHEAAKKGIRVVPVGASGINKATEYLMRAIALGTNGTYTFLTDHSGIGNSHIEPSTDEYKVESFNDIMVRILKTYTYMPDCDQNIPDLDLNFPDSIVFYPNNLINDSSATTGLDSISNPERDSLLTGRDSLLSNEDSLLTYHDSIGRINDQNKIDPKKIVWSYFPNPTSGIVNIKSEVDISELYITDLSGKVLQIIRDIEHDRVHQVDLSAYVTGIYLLRYPYEDNWLSGKVVLHR